MKGYYINLNYRTDRKQHMEDIKKRYSFFKHVERFPAFLHQRGDIGCTMSHIAVLHELYKKKERYYLLLEDDFIILNV